MIINIVGATLAAALWYRTRRLRRDLQATQQEVEIQRIVMDQDDTPPKRRRLHALAVI